MFEIIHKFRPCIRGRLGRIDYLLSFTFWNSLIFLCCLMGVVLLAKPFNFIKTIVCYLTLAVIFTYALSHLLTATIRRLHDIDFNGWWLIPLFVPVIVESWLFFLFTLPATTACTIASFTGFSCTDVINLGPTPFTWLDIAVIYALFGFWWLIMFVIPGTPLPNRFGEVTPASSRRLLYIFFRVGMMLLIATLPLLLIAVFFIMIAGMRG